jgi:hypothetical protein
MPRPRSDESGRRWATSRSRSIRSARSSRARRDAANGLQTHGAGQDRFRRTRRHEGCGRFPANRPFSVRAVTGRHGFERILSPETRVRIPVAVLWESPAGVGSYWSRTRVTARKVRMGHCLGGSRRKDDRRPPQTASGRASEFVISAASVFSPHSPYFPEPAVAVRAPKKCPPSSRALHCAKSRPWAASLLLSRESRGQKQSRIRR